MNKFHDAGIVEEFAHFIGEKAISSYHMTHKLRYIETFHRANQQFGPNLRTLELGGKSILAEFFEEKLNIEIDMYAKDLRRPFNIENSTYDLVLMLEVLEHLSDLPQENASIEEIATFSGSGARNALHEVYRILKPSGCLILTTPNASSVDIISRVLLGLHPYQYAPHVREYTPSDAIKMFEGCGFTLAKFDTFFAWNSFPNVDRDKILGVVKDLGFSAEHRGDDAFYILKKPS